MVGSGCFPAIKLKKLFEHLMFLYLNWVVAKCGRLTKRFKGIINIINVTVIIEPIVEVVQFVT